MAGGVVLLYTLGAQDRFAAGNGWGIIVQGGFLFFFDLLHALATPRREAALPALDVFSGPEHAPFRLNGSEGHTSDAAAPAALLVHGFGGTPAEMRGLAAALPGAGWTVEALLLPGFGADIATLTGRRYQEWLDAVMAAAQGLRDAGHRPLLLVGYSMGATLALALWLAGAGIPALDAAIAGVGVALGLTLWGLSHLRFRFPLWLALLYPLSLLLGLFIAVRSVVLVAQGRSTWKGRTLIQPQIRWW